MSNQRVLHFTSQGFKPQLINIAPDAENPASKRFSLIQKEDKRLISNLGDLEEGTRQRNRALEARLNEVWDMGAEWEAKLRTEVTEAEESVHQLKDDYQIHMDNFRDELLLDVKTIFDKYDNELIPEQNDRVEVAEKDMSVFFTKIAPDAIEAKSGEVSRQLKKEYESFDIEQQKEMNREKKFVGKAGSHVQNAAQRANDEDALMAACFHTLTDDVVENERRGARMHLRRWDNAMSSIAHLRDVYEMEKATREEEDIDLLDTVVDTQKKLQQTILIHFGNPDDDKPVKYPVMSKLNKRMNKKNGISEDDDGEQEEEESKDSGSKLGSGDEFDDGNEDHTEDEFTAGTSLAEEEEDGEQEEM